MMARLRNRVQQVVLVFLLFNISPAFAGVTSITDLNLSDSNVIDSSYLWKNSAFVVESYGENKLVLYPSHDGYAVVNDAQEFFNKEVTVNSAGTYKFYFDVTNNTPYTWSDYHFLINDPSVVITSWSSLVFENSNYDGTELAFWAPDYVAVGATDSFVLELQIAGATTFTISQVATAVPVPSAVLLLGSGLIGLCALRKNRRS